MKTEKFNFDYYGITIKNPMTCALIYSDKTGVTEYTLNGAKMTYYSVYGYDDYIKVTIDFKKGIETRKSISPKYFKTTKLYKEYRYNYYRG